MADTEDSSATGEEKNVVKKAPSAKKKAPVRKKVVAKKAATKKRVAKKKVAKAEPATTPTPAPPPMVWDDDDAAPSLMSMVINFAPIALLILLMLILDSRDGVSGQASVMPTNTPSAAADSSNVVSADLIEAIASGAIELPENFDPWAYQQSLEGDAGQAWSLQNLQQLEEDPAAFYWGEPSLDEAPPVPDSQ